MVYALTSEYTTSLFMVYALTCVINSFVRSIECPTKGLLPGTGAKRICCHQHRWSWCRIWETVLHFSSRPNIEAVLEGAFLLVTYFYSGKLHLSHELMVLFAKQTYWWRKWMYHFSRDQTSYIGAFQTWLHNRPNRNLGFQATSALWNQIRVL